MTVSTAFIACRALILHPRSRERIFLRKVAEKFDARGIDGAWKFGAKFSEKLRSFTAQVISTRPLYWNNNIYLQDESGASKTWKAQNRPLFTEKYPHIIRTTKALCPRAPDCTTAARSRQWRSAEDNCAASCVAFSVRLSEAILLSPLVSNISCYSATSFFSVTCRNCHREPAKHV